MIIVVNKKICQKKFCLIQFSFIWLIILVCNFKRPYKSNENKSTNQKHLIQFACDLQRCFSNWIKLGYKFLLICRWLLVSSLQRCLSLLIELLFSGTLRYTPAVRHTGTRQPARGDYISIHMLTLCSFNQISLQGWSMLLHSWFVWQIRIIFHIIEQCFIHDKNPTALRLIFGYQFSLFMQIIRRGSRIRLFSLVDLIVFWQRLMYILFHPFFPIFFFLKIDFVSVHFRSTKSHNWKNFVTLKSSSQQKKEMTFGSCDCNVWYKSTEKKMPISMLSSL